MRSEELPWATHTVRPGESLIAQCIDRALAPDAGIHGAVTVRRDLPDVHREVSRVAWPASRAWTYHTRSKRRQLVWSEEAVDLVHVHYVNRFTDSWSTFPRPLVLSVHDVRPHQPRLGRLEVALLARLYRRGDALVVHHGRLRERLIKEFAIDARRTHVVPHEVFPAPDFKPPPDDAPPTVLFFGALRPNKGLEILIAALEYLPSADLRVVIAGAGDRPVERLAASAAAADPRITLELERVSLQRKHELFAQASVVALPYTSFASQSGVLHDAYAFERPVIVTDVGALGETVREDSTGAVARPSDPKDFAARLREALEPQRWAAFSAAARRIREDRSPAKTGMRLRAVYDTVL